MLGYYQAPLPKPGEVYDLSGTFNLPAASGGTLDLFLPALGAKTTIWLNGRELARDIDTAKVGPALRLDPAQLVAGMNRVQLIVTPFDDKLNHIPEITRLGSVRVATPAPPARRSLFNGLAQVIVQSTRAPGEIRLTGEVRWPDSRREHRHRAPGRPARRRALSRRPQMISCPLHVPPTALPHRPGGTLVLTCSCLPDSGQ